MDWKTIAVNLARGQGTYHMLTTPERDALEAAVAEENRDPQRREFGGSWQVHDAMLAGMLSAPVRHNCDLRDSCMMDERCVGYANCSTHHPVPDPRE